MAVFTGSDNHGYSIRFEIWQKSQSVDRNETTFSFTYKLISTNNAYSNYSTKDTIKLNISWGPSSTWSKSISIGTHSEKNLWSDSFTVKHYDDGNLTLTFSGSFSPAKSAGYYPQYMSFSGSYTATHIPRYLSGVSVWVISQTETSVTWGWKANEDVSNVGYYWDNGDWWWVEQNVRKKSGSFVADNIQPGTAHQINIGLKRYDSGLWSYTGNKGSGTHGYPYCTYGNNYNIGEICTLRFYNPLGRSMYVEVYGDDDSIVNTFTTSNTIYNGFNAQSTIDNLLKSIPNKQYGHYKVKTVYTDSSGSKHEYTRNADDYYYAVNYLTQYEKIEAYDHNADIITVTKDDKIVVQNLSKIKTVVSNVTAPKFATLKKVDVTYDGVTKEYIFDENTTEKDEVSIEFDTSKSNNYVVIFTDSRGLTKTVNKTISFTTYSLPKLSLTCIRGVWDPIYLKWNDDEGFGTYCKCLLNGLIDERLEIDGSKSKVELNDEVINFSSFDPVYLGRGQLESAKGYAINAILYDNLGRSITATGFISSGHYVMSIINQNGVSFGTSPQKNKFMVRNMQLDTIYNPILNNLLDYVKTNTIHLRYQTRTVTQGANKEDYWWFGNLVAEPGYGRECFVDILGSNGQVIHSKSEYKDSGVSIWLRNWGGETSITITVVCLYFHGNTMSTDLQTMQSLETNVNKMNNGINPED